MKCRVLQTWLLQLALSILPSPAPGEDWTRFRGPNGSGVSKDTAFPVEFAKNKNAVWRVPVRRGKSSPVLTDHHIFLTGFENDKLFTQCFDRETGNLVWELITPRILFLIPSRNIVRTAIAWYISIQFCFGRPISGCTYLPIHDRS